MKKHLIFVIIILASVLGLLCINLYFGRSQMYNMSSQLQHNYFMKTTDRYFAEFYSGEREQSFEYNGISTPKIAYGIFSIKLFGDNNYAKSLNAFVKLNGNEYIFILEKNPFNGTFMCDVGSVFKDDANIEILIENIDDGYVKLDCVSNSFKINCYRALEKGFDTLKSFIKENSKNNKSCECYLTIAYNKFDEETNYFWVFMVKSSNLQSKNAVIDVFSGDVLFVS